MMTMQATALGGLRLESPSVAALVYERVRALILSGELEAGARLGQAELADALGVSRTPVREALRRLTGEGLVDALDNRGFRVADLGLEAVMRRLEVRLLLEPGIARLAADRADQADVLGLRERLEDELAAEDAVGAHDASRAFHVGLAQATGNPELVRILDGLWIVEVGRRLLTRRAAEASWPSSDVAEHRAILAAVERRDGERAEALMRAHVSGAIGHWRHTA